MAERGRKLERAREALAAKDEEARAKSKEEGQTGGVDRPQDEQDARATNSGDGKKSADKWNQ